MEYMQGDYQQTQGKILCCQCGTPVDPNPANMCVACIRTRVDITEGIPKQGILYFCKGCERYLQPPNQWVRCILESRELLALCLKKLKGLNCVRLIDAGFVWTEPHSKRIKVRLKVQAEVLGGAVLQQVFVVEFVVSHQFCDDCRRNEAKDFWRALVQVRQKTDHKKTFYYLEQLILKYSAHTDTLGIKPCHDGLDFYYTTEASARKMVEFLQSVVPCKYQTSKKLISHDDHSNLFNYKFTFSVEIVPVCKDNIVCLPAKLAHHLGGIGQICIVLRVSSSIQLIDPNTNQLAEINSSTYWRHPFSAVCQVKQLTEYVVMDIEVIRDSDRRSFAGQGATSNRHVLADVWVVRASELGLAEDTTHCRSHMGYILKPGDTVLGFDIANSNVNDSHFEKMKKEHLSDVVLVKKLFGSKSDRHKRRSWKLKRLTMEGDDQDSSNRDYDDFLEDLEEDPAYRQSVNIYRDREKTAVDTDDIDDEDFPRITLEEMLDDLHLEDGTGGEGAVMVE